MGCNLEDLRHDKQRSMTLKRAFGKFGISPEMHLAKGMGMGCPGVAEQGRRPLRGIVPKDRGTRRGIVLMERGTRQGIAALEREMHYSTEATASTGLKAAESLVLHMHSKRVKPYYLALCIVALLSASTLCCLIFAV